MKFREMTTAQLQEESLIDLGFAILEDKKNSITLTELFEAIQKLNGFSDSDMASRKPQFYTDMNIDGRFLATAENQWGLREWYPVDQIEEETAPTVKVRKKKSKNADDEDLDEIEEDEIVFEEFDEFVEEDDEDEDDEVVDFVEVEIDEVIEEDLIDEDEEEFEIIDEDEDLDDEDLEDEE